LAASIPGLRSVHQEFTGFLNIASEWDTFGIECSSDRTKLIPSFCAARAVPEKGHRDSSAMNRPSIVKRSPLSDPVGNVE
jgi:hypothetical protein